MSEIEQLRKEINELRERIAMLEARPAGSFVVGPSRVSPTDPAWVTPGLTPPWVVTC